jgi:tetratricopeptide (TPR) repeat protein
VKCFAVLICAACAFGQVPQKKTVPGSAPQQVAIPAVSQCDTLRRHGDPDAKQCYQKLIRSSDPGIRAEGFWGIGDAKQANEEFITAVKAQPKDANLWTRRGRMFIESSQTADATDWFNNALEINKDYAPAILGLALIAADGFAGGAADLAKKALTLDPKLAEAQELLARIALEDGNLDKAESEAKKALDISPEALHAMAILATVDWLRDKTSTPWMDRALKINPMYGEGYATAGHFFVINRRYDEGIKAYRKAIEIKSDLWSAKVELGINLMRFGEEAEPRRLLEETFNAGYISPPRNNALKLLDKYKNYETFKTPTTVIRLDKKEAALLRPYFQQELDRAIRTYEEKYKFHIDAPIQVEVYPNHAGIGRARCDVRKFCGDGFA